MKNELSAAKRESEKLKNEFLMTEESLKVMMENYDFLLVFHHGVFFRNCVY